MVAVTYGGFNLSDGVNYFVTDRSVSFPAINPSVYKIGRLEGMKKVGENVNERKIQLTVRVVGTSRSDLENKIDALLQAVFKRNQNLAMHVNDNRYFICDCVDAKWKLGPGNVITTSIQLDFMAYTPFAYAASQTIFDTGTVTLGGATVTPGSKLFSSNFSVTGGGNVYNRPVIRIYQRTPAFNGVTMTGSTLNKGQIYGSITCTATPQILNIGDDLILTSGSNTQSVVVSATTPAGATTIQVGGFSANFAYPAGTTITRDLTWQYIQMNQTTDQTALTINSNLPAVSGDYLDINCDPLQTNGYTVTLNGSSTLSSLIGSFPVLQPGPTNFTFSIYANSDPQIQIVWTYTSRWLS